MSLHRYAQERQKPAFLNDDLIIGLEGKTASMRALDQVDPALRQKFKNFDKNAFMTYIKCMYRVNLTNQKLPRTPENRLVDLKNAQLTMAALDIYDYAIRRRFYVLSKEFTADTALDVMQKRLEATAKQDGVILVKSAFSVNGNNALDIDQTFPFARIHEKEKEPARVEDQLRVSVHQKAEKFGRRIPNFREFGR